LADWTRHCDHRNEGEIDHHGADRQNSRGSGSRSQWAATSALTKCQVEQSTPDTFHVVETSSFQLEQIETFHPWIAVMLNFSPDHLDRHVRSMRMRRPRRESS
jgi:hypothetical protein